MDLPPLQSARKRRGSARAAPFLSWDSKCCPSVDMPSARSLPGAGAPFGRTGTHPLDHVPSSWFLPTSTVSSARRSRVCCTPQPDKGSSRFTLTGARRGRPSEDGLSHGTLPVALPATRFTPFEVFPPSTAAPHRCGRCLRAVTVPQAGRRSDSVKLRSAEADPHVTEREVPSRRRSDAGQPRRTSATGAEPRLRKRSRVRRGSGDRTRAGVGPPRAIRQCRPAASEDVVGGARVTEVTERGPGAASRPPKRTGCRSVEPSQSRSASRPCSVDRVRCRQAAVAGDRRSFLPWASFPSEVRRASAPEPTARAVGPQRPRGEAGSLPTPR